jgi:hypothetical protein
MPVIWFHCLKSWSPRRLPNSEFIQAFDNERGPMLDRIIDGRTDLVFDYLSEGHPANSTDRNGVSLIKWCAYYYEWRFSARLGELAPAPDLHSQEALLRQLFHSPGLWGRHGSQSTWETTC